MKWSATGQTHMGRGTVHDPACNLVGIEGEVSLPLTLDRGRLRVQAFGIEAYNAPGVVVISPWISAPGENVLGTGTLDDITARQLMSCAAHDGSNEIVGGEWIVPAGHTLHLMLQNGQQGPPRVFGWYLRGDVIDVR